MDQAVATEMMRMLGEIRELVDDDGVDWSTLGAAFLGGVLAISGGVVQSWFSDWSRTRHERTVVRSALMSEIASLVEIAEIRNYKRGLEAVRDGEQKGLEVIFTDTVNPIFQANITNLGLLESKEAADIIRFHGLIQSVILDVSPGGPIAEGYEDADERREAASEAIKILTLALTLGRSLIASYGQQKARH